LKYFANEEYQGECFIRSRTLTAIPRADIPEGID